MKIKELLKWIYGVFLVLMVSLLFMVILLYTNQLEIEKQLGVLAETNPDLGQASDYIKIIVLMFIVLIVLLAGLFVLLNRRISRPVEALLRQTKKVKSDLDRLTEATIEISQGQLSPDYLISTESLHFRHHDEFDELAKAQNEMLANLNETGGAIAMITHAMKSSRDKLKDVNKWLESAVNERTIDLKQANEQLEAANRELSQLDKAKSEFLRLVSHEIRTPLNGIQGFMMLVKDMPQAVELADIFELLEESVKRLERFSLVALFITELHTRNIEIRRENIPVLDLIQPALKKSERKINLKNLRINLGSSLSTLEITGDRRMLEICIESILDNAEHYSFRDGEINVISAKTTEMVTLEFIDRGSGFSAQALEHMFRLFAPGEQHIDENVGLDLALVKMIMDAHSGNIELGNNPEGGAYVRLIFRR